MKIQMKDITEDGILVMHKLTGELWIGRPWWLYTTSRRNDKIIQIVTFGLETYSNDGLLYGFGRLEMTDGKFPDAIEFIGYI